MLSSNDIEAIARMRRAVREFISLNGTIVNCAGGPSLGHRSWISGEEAVDQARDAVGVEAQKQNQ